MLIVLSPAKTLDYETPLKTRKSSQPALIERSAALVEDARKLSPADIGELMGISDKLAVLNHERFMNWGLPFTPGNARPSVLAFKGDVYTGLDADTMDAGDFDYAQEHLRILSGLYGVLRPLDLMQPYRLEMGLKFANSGGRNLYDFWGDDITGLLNEQLEALQSEVLVNLASNEYFKSVKARALAAEVITPVFKDLKNGKYRVISFFAKKARGQMARYAIDKRLEDVEELKQFRVDGYRFNKAESSARDWVFTREQV
jgi:cytoplasmic iron level regulating protein YaaA (DUF328/UPF0246 family)